MRVQLSVAERLSADGQRRAFGKVHQCLLQSLGDRCFCQLEQMWLRRLIQTVFKQQLIHRLQTTLAIALGWRRCGHAGEVVIVSRQPADLQRNQVNQPRDSTITQLAAVTRRLGWQPLANDQPLSLDAAMPAQQLQPRQAERQGRVETDTQAQVNAASISLRLNRAHIQAAVFDQNARIRQRQPRQRVLLAKVSHAMPVVLQLGTQFTQGQAVTDEHNLQALHCSDP